MVTAVVILFAIILVCDSLGRALANGKGLMGWWLNLKDYAILIVLLTPQIIQDNYIGLTAFINVIRGFLLIYYLIIQCFVRKKMDWLFGIILLKALWMIISDYLNQCGYTNAIRTIAIETLLYFFIKSMTANVEYEKRFMISTVMYLFYRCAVNALTVFCGGIYISSDNRFVAFFLGDKNTQAAPVLTALFITLAVAVNTGENKFKRIFILNYLFAALAAIIANCGTLKGILILGIICVFPLYMINFNKVSFIMLTLSIELLIVVFQIQKYMDSILYLLLKKQSNFTGRTYLWSQAMTYISKRPWRGYGYDTVVKLLGMNRFYEYNVYSAHNAILQKWLGIGAIGVMFYLVLFYLPIFRRGLRGRKNDWVINMGLLCFFLGGLAETYLWCTDFLFTYFLLYYVNIDHWDVGTKDGLRSFLPRKRIVT